MRHLLQNRNGHQAQAEDVLKNPTHLTSTSSKRSATNAVRRCSFAWHSLLNFLVTSSSFMMDPDGDSHAEVLFTAGIKLHFGRMDHKWMALNSGVNGV